MKPSLSLIIIFVVISGLSASLPYEDEFRNFIHRYRKNYTKGSEEYWRRYDIFKDNYMKSKVRNMTHDGRSAYYGITKFSDMTPEEFKDSLNLRQHHDTYGPQPNRPLLFRPRVSGPWWQRPELKDLPKRVDWREKNIISPVKEQRNCGACWAFSNVATIEAMAALKTGQLHQYSVQEMIDCARMGNYGCIGGDTCRSLNWLNQDNITLYSEEAYPLTLTNNTCKRLPPSTPGIKLKSFTCQKYVGNEEEMLRLLANHGPLVVTVDASSWNDYLGGIITYHCQNYHNHAVQIIGYDLNGPVPFYIIKNSWGTDFGDHGYMYIKIGENLCGLSDRVSTVDV